MTAVHGKAIGNPRAVADQLGDGLTLLSFGVDREARGGIWWGESFTDEDREQAQAGLDHAAETVAGGEYDLVVLDEVNVALDWKLIHLEDLLSLMDEKPDQVELILTGRYAHPEVIARADLVTEMREIKHPYQKGLFSRKGIDY